MSLTNVTISVSFVLSQTMVSALLMLIVGSLLPSAHCQSEKRVSIPASSLTVTIRSSAYIISWHFHSYMFDIASIIVISCIQKHILWVGWISGVENGCTGVLRYISDCIKMNGSNWGWFTS